MAATRFVSSLGMFSEAVTGGQERALGSRGADLAEGMIGQIEQSQALDALAQTVGSLVSKVLPPGKLKDLVSGTWLGHPAHPMLTDLPIGAWTSALLLDLIGGRAAAEGADTLIGIGVLAALPTAITGLSELADLGTEHERAIAAAHAIGNTAALALYVASYVARKAGIRSIGVGLSTAGAGVMMASAFLGGHLSFRKGIGVDHTAFEYPVEDWTPVLADDELGDGEARLVNAAGNDVMLYRSNGTLCALADRCMHAGGPLHEGSIEGGRVTCPWHASTFNLADGSLVRAPATAPQPSYEARVQDGKIEVRSRS
ncbi:MAG: Rieske 2Fe-2S domain-containing protein [Candidatus Dormibacteria bacterium]